MRPRADESRSPGARPGRAGGPAALSPAMFEAFRNWRRERIVRRARLDAPLWEEVIERYPFTRALDEAERARLRRWAILFLNEKSIVAAGGLVLTDEMRL